MDRNRYENIIPKSNMSEKEKRRQFCNMDVVMVGFAGLSGSVTLADKKYEELRSRYSAAFIQGAKEQKVLLKLPVFKKGAAVLYPLSRGGVFTGLWNMAEEACVGLEIDLKKIPIRQETVEICNFFDINPYQLLSEGSFLILSDNGGRLKMELQKKGIISEVIGVTTDNNDRVVINGEEKRFLEKHYDEELEKAMGGRGNINERAIIKNH